MGIIFDVKSRIKRWLHRLKSGINANLIKFEVKETQNENRNMA